MYSVPWYYPHRYIRLKKATYYLRDVSKKSLRLPVIISIMCIMTILIIVFRRGNGPAEWLLPVYSGWKQDAEARGDSQMVLVVYSEEIRNI